MMVDQKKHYPIKDNEVIHLHISFATNLIIFRHFNIINQEENSVMYILNKNSALELCRAITDHYDGDDDISEGTVVRLGRKFLSYKIREYLLMKPLGKQFNEDREVILEKDTALELVKDIKEHFMKELLRDGNFD